MDARTDDLSNEDVLLREDADGVTRLTLNRPDKYNAMSEDLVERLHATLKELAQDPACRVIVLAAAGDKAFCPGHDLKEMIEANDHAFYEEAFRRSAALTKTMISMPQPIVARVQGLTTAGGCQIVAACDMAIASSAATFSANGITNGLFCAMPSVTISRNVPRKQAFNMLFTGAFIDAAQAQEIGLVNKVVEPEELDTAVAEVTAAIRAKPATAVARGKEVFYQQLQMPLSEALDFTAGWMAEDMDSDTAREGVNAFIEKRKPVWD
ncbi:MAG TPA: enoyl-CoA hydratase [Alphaproteobacteria bacterium]|nr:enoyl-CoA hydratase [Alphaproteobacteria bacterium]